MKKWLVHFPWIAYSGFIFYLSSQQKLDVPDLHFNLQDKVFHFLAFTLYGIFVSLSVLNWPAKWLEKLNWMRVAAVIGIIYGFLDEIHQYFVPGREMDIWDWVADSLGVLTGILILKFFSGNNRLASLLNYLFPKN
ncbi:MAG: hypothetical protein Kow0037_06850 [Calditrichia bacterium]